MDSKYKIGVIINDFKFNKFERDTILKLKSSKLNPQIFAILEKEQKENILEIFLRKFKQHGFFRILEIIFFKILFFTEKKLTSIKYSNINYLNKDFEIDKNIFHKIIDVDPVFSNYKMYSDYTESDKQKILNENLDIVIRGNVSNIYKDNKLNISKFGVISFHHGDNIWNRGGPPGFWETVLKKNLQDL